MLCSDRERERGDHEVWECSGNAVGVKEEDVGMRVKFIYDHVLSPQTTNQQVYKAIASPIVQSAMDGINGTIFACECAPAAHVLPHVLCMNGRLGRLLLTAWLL